MKILFLAIFASLIFASTASSHNRNTWYWNHFSAEKVLLNDGIEYADGSYADVARARCFGRGDSLAPTPPRTIPLFRHFRCYGMDTDGYRVNVLLHVKGKYAYVLTDY